MSLILDALKKSEQNRHDDAGSVLPLIVEPRRAKGKKRKKSPVVPLAIIFFALAALVVVYLLGSGTPDVSQQSPAISPAVKTDKVAEHDPEPVTKQSPQVTVAPVEVSAESPSPLEVSSPTPAETAEPSGKPGTDVERQQTLQEAGILSTRDTTAVPPRLSKITGGLRKEVSPLRLDFHVYSMDRQRRIVFINGQEYREGMLVRNNLEVVRIVPEGAVMEWKGRQFLLTVSD
jgi:hypothetical protein